jgi:hypothetical protein
MFAALLAYTLACAATVAIEEHALAPLDPHPVVGWLNDHVARPILANMAVLAFVLAGVPALFDLASAPSAARLLAPPGRLNEAMELLWLLALLLGFVPWLRQRLTWLLPIQSLAVVAVVGSWLARARNLSLSYWPSAGLWLELVALGLAGVFIAAVARPAFDSLDWPLIRERLARRLAMFAFQVPLILAYARFLGSQLNA